MRNSLNGFVQFLVLGLVAVAAVGTLLTLKIAGNKAVTPPLKPVNSVPSNSPKVILYFDQEFTPGSKGSQISLFADTGPAKISFIRADLVYDPTKIKIVKGIEITGALTTVVKLSKFSDANKTGQAEIILGLKPGDSAPLGKIEIARFAVQPVAKNTGQSELNFNPDTAQVVTSDAVNAQIELVPFKFNPD